MYKIVWNGIKSEWLLKNKKAKGSVCTSVNPNSNKNCQPRIFGRHSTVTITPSGYRSEIKYHPNRKNIEHFPWKYQSPLNLVSKLRNNFATSIACYIGAVGPSGTINDSRWLTYRNTPQLLAERVILRRLRRINVARKDLFVLSGSFFNNLHRALPSARRGQDNPAHLTDIHLNEYLS